MRARSGVLAGAAALVTAFTVATGSAPAADSWPVFGGSGARAGLDANDGGDAPWTTVWQRDLAVRNSPIVTDGGGPDVQRVAYATLSQGRVTARLRRLDTGAPVGPEAGIEIDNGSAFDDGAVGEDPGSVAFADTSTPDRLGQIFVLHNDDGGNLPNVSLQRIDAATGTVGPDEVIVGSGTCRVASSPLLTPPGANGARLLFFTMTGTCTAGASLVRVVINGDATRPDTPLMQSTHPVAGLNETPSPSLVVLTDPATGTPTYYVAVPRDGAIDFYDAGETLSTTTAPEITAALPSGEEPQTVAGPLTPSGLIAGAEGSGIPAAPALYVATQASGQTRVHKLVQDAANRAQMNLAKSTDPLPNSGPPAPAGALSEIVTPSGVQDGGRFVVTSEGNLTVLRTSDLGVVAQIKGDGPLPGNTGFARTTPAISGGYVYVARDGDPNTPSDHLVLRLADLSPAPFTQSPANAAAKGDAWGQPAIARGFAVFGSAAGAIAYRNADVTPPAVEIAAPASGETVAGAIDLVARAADARGVASAEFRLSTDNSTIVLGRDTSADGSTFSTIPGGGGRFSLVFQSGSVQNGDYYLDVVATDASGRTAATPRRRIRIANKGGGNGVLPPGSCMTEKRGTAGADSLGGSPFGDRLLGGAGDDRINAGAGHDCLYGEAGRDLLDGGSGEDLVDGGTENDRASGGAGRDQVNGGAGNDTLRGNGDADRLSGGAGRDTIFGGDGDDRLTGGDGNDTLRGDAGNDRIVGGRGNDRIVAGGGTNSIEGGAGSDTISAANGRRDAIACGSGRDRVTADRRDRVSKNCERVTRRR